MEQHIKNLRSAHGSLTGALDHLNDAIIIALQSGDVEAARAMQADRDSIEDVLIDLAEKLDIPE